MKGLLAVALIGAAVATVMIVSANAVLSHRWQVGDQLSVFIEEEQDWNYFTILDIKNVNGVLSYLVGEGWPPNIIDQNWGPVSEFDKLTAYKVN